MSERVGQQEKQRDGSEKSAYGKMSLEDGGYFAVQAGVVFDEEMNREAYRLRAKQGLIDRVLGKKKHESDDTIYRPNLNMPTSRQVEKAVEVLEHGTIDGRVVDDAIIGRWNSSKAEKKRLEMARLELVDPITTERIVAQNIQGWHGVSSRGLIGILRHGMHSQYGLTQKGLARVTGESLPVKEAAERKFVSFTADIGTAVMYAGGDDYTSSSRTKYIQHDSDMAAAKAAKDFIKNELKSGNKLARKNFPVLVGISGDYVKHKKSKGEAYTVLSDMSNEFGLDGVDRQEIKVLAVPDDQRQLVLEALEKAGLKNNIQIVSFDSLKYVADKHYDEWG